MSNYVAIIAKIDTTLPIEKADKIQVAKVLLGNCKNPLCSACDR